MAIHHMDRTYHDNIRDYLLHRAHSVRIDANFNLLSLAVYSDNFYVEFLNELLDLQLEDANVSERNTAGIDLIDWKNRVAVQVSVTCAPKTIREKIRRSIRKFDKPEGDWQFYFVPITDKAPDLQKGFELPDGLIFDKNKDVLDISRIMELAKGIERLRKLSELVDRYSKDETDDLELRKKLDELLLMTWTAHPSYKMMQTDEIDHRLFPNVKDMAQFETMGKRKDEDTESPVWSIIRGSWSDANNHPVMIQGSSGIGKTVSLFSLTNLNKDLIPAPAVYVPMFELVNQEGKVINLTDYFQLADTFSSLTAKQREGLSALAAKPWDRGPSLLVLLDGFNEVPGNQRWNVLRMLKTWHENNQGAQLIAVSRPMDNLSLETAFGKETISVTLSELSKESVTAYLKSPQGEGVRIPDPNSPIWETIVYPLFLNQYIKVKRLRVQQAWRGFPLDIRDAAGPGSIIWNYLQRELLRQEDVGWILRCAMACEYFAPILAHHMLDSNDYTISQRDALAVLRKAASEMNLERMPNHITELFSWWETQELSMAPPLFLRELDWPDILLRECGLLVPFRQSKIQQNGRKHEPRFEFLHQSFRDCLAGIYLLNQAETVGENEFPAIWSQLQNDRALNYAAELVNPWVLDRLWEANQEMAQYDGNEAKKTHTATCNLLELYRRNKALQKELDFSGMDLRGLSLTRYLGKNGPALPLFRSPDKTRRTALDRSVFESEGHGGTINALAVLTDGRVVSGSDDNTLRVWDTSTGQCLQTLMGHSKSVSCMAILPEGRIVSGSDDMTLRVWDITTGKCLRTLEGQKSPVKCIATLPDGHVISGSSNGVLRVWDTTTGHCLRILEGHSFSVKCVVALPDGRVVSGSKDHTLRVWDTTTGRCLQTLVGHSSPVNCLSALPNGCVISGAKDNTLRVWDSSTGECLQTLVGHSKSVSCVATLSGRVVVSGSDDNTLRVWDIATGKCSHILEGYRAPIKCIATLSEGRIIINQFVNCFQALDISSGQRIETFAAMEVDVSEMDFSEALLPTDLAKHLWQNGAKISIADYQKMTSSNHQTNTTKSDSKGTSLHLGEIVNSVLSDSSDFPKSYDVFLERLNNVFQSICAEGLVQNDESNWGLEEWSFLFAFDKEKNAFLPACEKDLQELLYQLFLIDSDWIHPLVIADQFEDVGILERETISDLEAELSKLTHPTDASVPEEKHEPAKELTCDSDAYLPSDEDLEEATKLVLQDFEIWLDKELRLLGKKFQIIKHVRRQEKGEQYGYDVGLTFNIDSASYMLCFECKDYISNIREAGKNRDINARAYAINLLKCYINSESGINNRWVLVSPFGDIQNNYLEDLFLRWNVGHSHLKIFAIVENDTFFAVDSSSPVISCPSCSKFLSVNETAYRLVYGKRTPPPVDKEVLFRTLLDEIIGGDYVKQSVDKALKKYDFPTEFQRTTVLLSEQTNDDCDAFDLSMEILSGLSSRVDSAVTRKDGLYIIGEYGTGKTWLVYRMIQTIQKRSKEYPFAPILMRLKEPSFSWDDSKKSIPELVEEYIDLILKKQDQIEEYSIFSKRPVFFLDGFDETLSGLSSTDKKIQILLELRRQLKANYPSALFVVTSRESDYSACYTNSDFIKLFKGFYKIELKDGSLQMTKEKILELSKVPGKNQEALRQLADNNQLLEIARRPVFFRLLSMLAEDEESSLEGVVDQYSLLDRAITREIEKTPYEYRNSLQEMLFRCAMEGTQKNTNELSVRFHGKELQNAVPLGIFSIQNTRTKEASIEHPWIFRADQENECIIKFLHNIVREFLVAKQFTEKIIRICEKQHLEEKRELEQEFFSLLSQTRLSPASLRFFMGSLQRSPNRIDCENTIKGWLCRVEVKSNPDLAARLLELLLQPGYTFGGEKETPLQLNGIQANNLYVWNCCLQHINLHGAKLQNMQMIATELYDVDLRAADLSGLRLAPAKPISDVVQWSEGNIWNLLALYQDGQLLRYTFTNRFVLDPYSVRIMSLSGVVGGLSCTSEKLLLHSDKSLYLLDDSYSTAEELFRLRSDNVIRRIRLCEGGSNLAITNNKVKSVIAFRKNDFSWYQLDGTAIGKYCFTVDGMLMCVKEKKLVLVSKDGNTKLVCEWDDGYECFGLRRTDTEAYVIYIKCSDQLITIDCDSEYREIIRHEYPIKGDNDFMREIEAIKENVLVAVGESEIYILMLEENTVNSQKLNTAVKVSDTQLQNVDGSERLTDQVAHDLIIGSMAICNESSVNSTQF